MTLASAHRPLRFPALIVFISNTCLMVLELVAGRLMAPYLGVSLYTWTSIIGVILAGITVGNYLGGRLADRAASRRLLGLILMTCALASLAILPANRFMAEHSILSGAPIQLRIIAITATIFLLPAVLLGLISPVVVKLSLATLDRAGNVVGRIYAAGAAGSIVGTFATGFYLVALFGTHAVVLGVAAVLAGLGLLVSGAWRQPGWLLLAGLLTLSMGVGLVRADLLRAKCLRESNYFCIKIREEETDGVRFRALVLDRLLHSWVDPDNPQNLRYGYEVIYRQVMDRWAESWVIEAPRTLFIGGGGYTFPRFVESAYGRAVVHVVEIDPAVTETVYESLGLPRDTTIRTYNQDARAFLNQLPADSQYDFIFGDAFNDFSVPYHLTTREFASQVSAHLAPDGLYMVNIIDGRHGLFLRAFVRTLQSVFPHVAVSTSSDNWRTLERHTFVIVAGNQPLDDLFLQDRNFLSPDELQRYLDEAEPIILTDSYAPVDNLLAPVYRDSGF